jgi:hypothetical protein
LRIPWGASGAFKALNASTKEPSDDCKISEGAAVVNRNATINARIGRIITGNFLPSVEFLQKKERDWKFRDGSARNQNRVEYRISSIECTLINQQLTQTHNGIACSTITTQYIRSLARRKPKRKTIRTKHHSFRHVNKY